MPSSPFSATKLFCHSRLGKSFVLLLPFHYDSRWKSFQQYLVFNTNLWKGEGCQCYSPALPSHIVHGLLLWPLVSRICYFSPQLGFPLPSHLFLLPCQLLRRPSFIHSSSLIVFHVKKHPSHQYLVPKGLNPADMPPF